MRILLLGCTGFIGKSLIPKLISDGHELCLISRKNINQLKINSSFEKIAFLKLNLAQEKNWNNINKKNADFIVRLHWVYWKEFDPKINI